MPIIFALRSDNSDFNARVCPALKVPVVYPGSGANRPSYESDANAIGGNAINLYHTSLTTRLLSYNMAGSTVSRERSVLMRARFPVVNTGTLGLWQLSGAPISLGHFQATFGAGATQTFPVRITNDFGSVNNLSDGSIGTPTFSVNVYYDIFISWDGTNNTNSLKAYINGVLLGQATPSGSWQSPFVTEVHRSLAIGFSTTGGSSRMALNEFIVWDEIIDPTSVALTGGTGSLNGASRTEFVDCVAIERGLYTDPLVANVKTGTTYTFAGVEKTGAFVGSGSCDYPTTANVRSGIVFGGGTGSLTVPTLANTKIGVAGDGGTGTYDGSDRWSAPDEASVLYGVQYKANSLTENRTGTYAPNHAATSNVRQGTVYGGGTGTLDLPATTDVKSGVTYDNATKTGTYEPPAQGACDYPTTADVRVGVTYGAGTGLLDLPAISDVLAGVSYDNATKTGTYAPNHAATSDVRAGTVYGAGTGVLVVPSLSNTKIGVAGDGGVGTYDGSDRWSTPTENEVLDGVEFMENSVERTGTLDLPATLNVAEGVTFANGTKVGTLGAVRITLDGPVVTGNRPAGIVTKGN